MSTPDQKNEKEKLPVATSASDAASTSAPSTNFARYVVPNMLGMVAVSINILTDTYFIANGVGAAGLAALNFAIVAWTLMQATGLMLGIGGGTRFQICISQGKQAEANRVFTNTVMLALGFAFAYLAIIQLFAVPIAGLLGADEETLSLTVNYLRVLFLFAPFFLMNNALMPFVRNDGKPRLSMAAMMVGNGTNIVLDYTFIFVFGWGMVGAAIATGIAPIMSLLLMSRHVFGGKAGFAFRLSAPSVRVMGGIAALGLSSFVVEISSGVVLCLLNLIILQIEGNIGVAAYGVVANIAFVATALFVGIAQGIQPLVSRSYALGAHRELARILRSALIVSVAVAAVFTVSAYVFAEPVVAAFNGEENAHLALLAEEGMRLYFVGYVFAGVNIIVAAFFSAAERPLNGLAVTLLRGLLVIVPMVLLFTALFAMTGVWLSFVVAEALTCVVAVVMLARTARGVRNASQS